MKEKRITITFDKPPKEERDTAKTVLIFLAVFIVSFVAVMIVTYWVKGSVPDTLIQYVLGAGGLEALLLAGIKIAGLFCNSKKKKPEQPEEDEERY